MGKLTVFVIAALLATADRADEPPVVREPDED